MHQAIKILRILLLSIATFIVAMLCWLYFIDGHFTIRQSITIQQSKNNIVDTIMNLKSWETWSPWLNSGIESDAKIDETTKELSWKNILGGDLLISKSKICEGIKTDTIQQKLRFSKPFHCETTLQWIISRIDSTSSTVELSIEGDLSYQYRYLARRVETILFMDLDRSLKLLADYVENGTINSTITIDGIEDQPERELIGIKNSCPSHLLDSAMQETFLELTRVLELNNIPRKNTLSCYYDFGINVNKQCEFMCAIIVNDSMKISALPAPLNYEKIKESKTLKISYTGDYKHLANAWVTGLTYIQGKGLKVKRRIAPYEIYVHTDANSSAPQNWKTELYIPIR